MGSFVDKTGMTVGRLTVIRRAQDHIDKKGHHKIMWECQCSCGNVVNVRSDSLTIEHTSSCGCYHKERASDAASKRVINVSFTKDELRIRNIWQLMKYRCENENSPAYDNYGGRGIKVCESWSNELDGYENFKSWSLSNGYCHNLTIDRIDNDKSYEPTNCRWISASEQNSNKRNNRMIEYNGEIHTLSEWSRIYNIPMKTLHARIVSRGWNLQKAFNKPVRAANHTNKIDG